MTPRVDRRQALVASMLLLALAVVPGCGPQTYPVAGKVLWQDDTPATELAGGAVVFESKDAKVSAQGELRSDATFHLTTYRDGDGALTGTYRVLVTEPIPPDSDRIPPAKMDRKFQAFETSGLEFTVEPAKNEAVFKVERARKGAR